MFLKRMVLGNMPVGSKDRDIVESVDFMVSRLEEMTQSQLASRLTLNCSPTYVMPQHLREIPITLIDVWDPYALAPPVREELLRSFPHAKRAHLKSGGNFPYLSRSDEVNMHIMLHLKQFEGSKWNAMSISGEEAADVKESR
ncbi:unnamed protein product [Notodromas monacha]|uniref:Maspardin n=1 Tax=Notodromas monacha TaxID=399045 RepID=A0A7R9C2H0_9CRUS|nr:unnamed protein product [Notodromas monacha]CAG0924911.1 unnamed protein product [Notodromas monacha]